MSKPKYLRSDKKAADAIIPTIEHLTNYVFQITNSEKQFPKAYRYTLVTQLRNTCLDLTREAYKACAYNPKHKKTMKRKLRHMEAVGDLIIDIKALLAVAFTHVSINNREYIAALMLDLISTQNEWYRRGLRTLDSLPTKTAYNRKLKQRASKARFHNMLKEEYEKLEKDKDGFVILKHKADISTGC